MKDVNELPSMEEFEKLVAESFQAELTPVETTESAPAAEMEAVHDEAAEEKVG